MHGSTHNNQVTPHPAQGVACGVSHGRDKRDRNMRMQEQEMSGLLAHRNAWRHTPVLTCVAADLILLRSSVSYTPESESFFNSSIANCNSSIGGHGGEFAVAVVWC